MSNSIIIITPFNLEEMYLTNTLSIIVCLLALPYSGIANVGALLPIMLQTCEEGYSKSKSPIEIIDYFFRQHTAVETEKEKIDHLFKYVQYMERQVVLFDAIARCLHLPR
jgi:hypothetical protein